MITLNENDPAPEGYVKYVNNGEGVIDYYFDDDELIVSEKLNHSRFEKYAEITNRFTEAELNLAVSKNEYKDLQAMSIASVATRGKTIAETKQKFKDAVTARKTLLDKRDDLFDMLNVATTIDEINAIEWTD